MTGKDESMQIAVLGIGAMGFPIARRLCEEVG